jgi:hypothetical protein
MSVTWQELRPLGDNNIQWCGFECNGDGTQYVASEYTNYKIWHFNGTELIDITPNISPSGFNVVGMSEDGKKILTEYHSSSYGLYLRNGSWSSNIYRNTIDYVQATLSKNGQKIFASSIQRLWNLNVDTWDEERPHGDEDDNWGSKALNYDGTKIIVASWYNPSFSNNNGRVWVKDENGWTEHRPTGDNRCCWTQVEINQDGTKMFALDWYGYLWRYHEGTWTNYSPFGWGGWIRRFAISKDGTKILAVASSNVYYWNSVQWIDLTGNTPTGMANFIFPRMDNDGRKLFLALGYQAGMRIYYYEVAPDSYIPQISLI